METRKCKVCITSPGGNASKGAEKHRLTIPTSWAKEMGFTKDDRDAVITFDGEQIIVRKNKIMHEENDIYNIYISSAAGLSYTGVWATTEKEAKELCKKYNDQDKNNPYCQHIYKKV